MRRTAGRDRRLVLAASALALVLLAMLLRRFGIAGGWWHAPDRALLLALRHADDLARPIGPHWLDQAMLAMTMLGTGFVLALTVVIAAGGLIAVGAWQRAAMLIGATWSGGVAVDAIKHIVARVRPTLVPHLIEVQSASFPSAHAANSTIVCLSIALLATRASSPVRHYAIVVAALLAVTIGASRVYLGVHWPSDVAAGWLFGFGWAMAWWWLADRLGGGGPARRARR